MTNIMLTGVGSVVAAASGIITTNTDTFSATAATSFSLTVSVGNGGTCAIAIGARRGGTGGTINSITLNGVPLVQQVTNDGGNGIYCNRTDVWSGSGISSSTACALNVVLSFTGPIGGSVYRMANAGSATAIHTGGNSSTTAPSVNATYAAGSSVIACATLEQFASSLTMAWSGAAGISTADSDQVIDAGNGVRVDCAHKDEASAGSSQAVTVTFSGTAESGGMAYAAFS